MNPNLLGDQLRDIRGLDQIPWWPLAPGWWLVAIGVLALLWLLSNRRLAVPRWSRPVRRVAWQRAAARELHQLRRRVARDDSKLLAGELSELLRRIAIARCGRESCAGLTGPAWLEWLAAHDPVGFDWVRHGTLLTRLPYAPPSQGEKATVLQTLIDAALAWTRPATPACTTASAAELDRAV